MTLLAADPALTDAAAAAAGVRRVTLPTLLAASDYVCLLCPLTDATRGMIGAAQLAGMKPGAVLVNTARGELVDEATLAAALSSGRLRHAALDVFAGINVFTPDGRFPTDHPLFGLPNATLTPHVAASSEEAAAEAHRGCAEAVVDVLSGRWPRWPVNPSVTLRVPLAPRGGTP
jgi:phosphoglycerate dehydrogenase-like enzyme